MRQVPGSVLWRNLTEPLPLRVIGDGPIPDWQRQTLSQQRDPRPHNGIARELFAADLLSVETGRLAHLFEQREKELLSIGEELGLRGAEYEAQVTEAVRGERERQLSGALAALSGMTLTVIDGDFPRPILARQNLTFPDYQIAAATNRREPVRRALRWTRAGPRRNARRRGFRWSGSGLDVDDDGCADADSDGPLGAVGHAAATSGGSLGDRAACRCDGLAVRAR